ncbi:hypothetical protein Pla52o_34920 [Novipirellula galeiformis]|uniref:Uncharacterized protein n=1 Tax=Novipirellula galeiformis TaxID=2528004 RepID=A0A5C6CGS0_9BACT|nr:hypothetical protein Pla52o_34920 [Novipirellula galeiformis]
MTETEETGAVTRSWGFSRLWAGMLIALILVTFPLWRGDEPLLQIPMLPFLHSWSPWGQWIPCLTLLAACAAILASAEGARRWLWWIVAAALCFAFLLNQHRLQPWAYQSAIYAVVFATMDRETARRWLIPLAASVYLYSGLGKIDYQFAHTVGQNFLAAIDLPGVGNLADRFEHNTLAMIALLLPLSEMLIGIGLLMTRTRRLAGALVIALHVSLIGMLGPWNLNHSHGVLLWNVLLIVQAWFLFLQRCPNPIDPNPSSDPGDSASTAALSATVPKLNHSIGQRFAATLVILAIVMPATERWGYWDHWTSWALYSPHSSRATVELHRSAREHVPAEMHPFLIDDDDDGWYRLEMNSWSLDRLTVPIYPQARFQLAVASRIAHQCDLRNSVRVIVKGVSDRRSGRRIEQRLLGRKEIDTAQKQYWLAR